MLPVKPDKITEISVVYDYLEYFSASGIAKLNLIGVPKSRIGIYKLADREKWGYIVVAGKGRKDGVKYYRVPDYLNLLIIEARESYKYQTGDSLKTPEDKKPIFDKVFGSSKSLNQNQADYQHTLYIEHYPDVRAAAGTGQVTPTDQVMVNVAINADELRTLSHKSIKLITVYGDSMKPTLSHGDQVFVDISCTNFIDDAIYAVQQGDLTRIKRIKLRFDGSIEVRSDNEKNGFTTETYNMLEAADFHVIGRVIPYKFGKFEI